MGNKTNLLPKILTMFRISRQLVIPPFSNNTTQVTRRHRLLNWMRIIILRKIWTDKWFLSIIKIRFKVFRILNNSFFPRIWVAIKYSRFRIRTTLKWRKLDRHHQIQTLYWIVFRTLTRVPLSISLSKTFQSPIAMTSTTLWTRIYTNLSNMCRNSYRK